MEEEFVALKETLTTPTLWEFTDFDQAFLVKTDSSSFAVRAVLAQKKED